MRVLLHSPLLRYLYFQIPNRYGTHGHVQTVFWRTSYGEFCTTGTETEAKFGERTQRATSMLAGFKWSCFLHVAQPLTLTVVSVLSRNAPSQKGRTLRDETREIRPLDIDMWMGSEKIGPSLNYQGRVTQFVIKKSLHTLCLLYILITSENISSYEMLDYTRENLRSCSYTVHSPLFFHKIVRIEYLHTAILDECQIYLMGPGQFKKKLEPKALHKPILMSSWRKLFFSSPFSHRH